MNETIQSLLDMPESVIDQISGGKGVRALVKPAEGTADPFGAEIIAFPMIARPTAHAVQNDPDLSGDHGPDCICRTCRHRPRRRIE